MVSSRFFLVGLALATAFALRVFRRYRPFPSDDDFAYIPVAWAAQNPALYPRDALVQQYQLLHHAPMWSLLVNGAESTVGLVWGFWLLTMALTVASVFAVLQLMRIAGATGYLLPMAVALAFATWVGGFGRGAVEGAFGNGLHIQWVAVCMLLWCYVAFATGRHLIAGVLLGVTFLAHPQVGLHGVFVLTIAALASERPVRGFLMTAIVAAVLASPVVLPLTRGLFDERREPGWSDVDLIHLVYLFRLPNEYTFAGTTTGDAVLFAVKGLIGVVGVLWLLRLERSPAARALGGLFLGHAVLLFVATIQMGGWGSHIWGERLTPYLLGLSRTTPVFLVLGGTLAVAVIERRLQRGSVPAYLERIRSVARGVEAWLPAHSLRMIGMVLSLGVVVLALVASRHIHGASRLAYTAPVLLGVVALLRARRHQRSTAEAAVAMSVAVICLAWIVAFHPRAAVVGPEKAGVFSWSRQSTLDTALFIVPPGLQEFRLYTRRSVYVDVKLFSPAVPSAGPLWRQRLVHVAAPDTATLEYRGWPGMNDVWDRSYAAHNTPERIGWLLRSTGANFFVRDLAAPATRPMAPNAFASVGLTIAYRNQRYEVYELGTPR
jgi:hypothetical protein